MTPSLANSTIFKSSAAVSFITVVSVLLFLQTTETFTASLIVVPTESVSAAETLNEKIFPENCEGCAFPSDPSAVTEKAPISLSSLNSSSPVPVIHFPLPLTKDMPLLVVISIEPDVALMLSPSRTVISIVSPGVMPHELLI